MSVYAYLYVPHDKGKFIFLAANDIRIKTLTRTKLL